jgi:hypothetical protein
LKGRDTPALSSIILQKYEDSNDYAEVLHYRAVIGKSNILEKSTRPDIVYSVHQCARFSANPKVEHAKALKLIARYLLATKNEGIICDPKDQSFECYCDADFSGNWNGDIAEFDSSTARSRTGYIVT